MARPATTSAHTAARVHDRNVMIPSPDLSALFSSREEPPAMPLFDFRCRSCGHEFEALVRPQDAAPPACPSCKSADLERQLATFAVSSAEKTRAAADKKRRK